MGTTEAADYKAGRAYERFLYTKDEETADDLLFEAEVALGNHTEVGSVPELAATVHKGCEIPEEVRQAYLLQHSIIEAAYFTVVRLLQIQDIDFGTSAKYNSFSIVLSQSAKHQKVQDSPKLSKAKMLGADPMHIAEAVIDLFMDRGKWDGDHGLCDMLSDWEGNWLG